MAVTTGPILDFIYGAEKERWALLPLYEHFYRHGIATRLVKIHRRNFFRSYIRKLAPYVVASYDLTIVRIKEAGWQGRTIYVDHGLSPVKYYAYRYTTFHEMDLLFYPGPIFKDIMQVLNPDFDNGLLGGLPKMDAFMAEDGDKVNLCVRLGLDPQRPVVVFAPTWGGKYNSDWGIGNARYLEGFPNLVISPHPADRKAARKFKAILPPPELGTNALIKIADLVISDVSSIVGEASLLGKPVLQLILPTYPGCYPVPDKRKQGLWLSPEQDQHFRDLSDPVKRPFKLAYLDLDWVLGHSCTPQALPETLPRVLSEPKRFLEERRFWNEQNCYLPDGRTNARLMEMIMHFIHTGTLKQLG